MPLKKNIFPHKSVDRKDFDAIVLNIEFLVVSIVQGLAFSSLASVAAGSLTLDALDRWPAIVAAFLLLLLFWSQAMLHAISFIRWPMDVWHTILYFLASFIEVIAFMHLGEPHVWFGLLTVFFAVVWLLYHRDLAMMEQYGAQRVNTKAERTAYDHMKRRHEKEMCVLTPFGFAFHSLAFIAVLIAPGTFSLGTVLLQAFVLLYGVIRSAQVFRSRVDMISDTFA